MADQINWSAPVQFDAAGRPFVVTMSGKQSFLPPIMAAEYAHMFVADPQQRAAVNAGMSADTIARLEDYARRNGVTAANPSGNVPNASFSKSRGEWNPTTGQYDQSMGSALKGVIIGGGALGGIAGASALAGAGAMPPSASTSAPAWFGDAAAAGGTGTGATVATGGVGGAAGGAASTAGGAATTGGLVQQLKGAMTDPKTYAGLAALLPALLGGRGGGSGSPFDTAGVNDELTKSLSMQRGRMEQAQPVYDTLVNMAYGMSPTRYRGAQAPAGYTPNGTPQGPYQAVLPKFGG